jgi:hypothetical protein
MGKRLIGSKYIILLLSVLLIAGAVVTAINLNGGNWFSATPVLAQPPDKGQQNVLVPVSGSGSDLQMQDHQTSPSGHGCDHNSVVNPADE